MYAVGPDVARSAVLTVVALQWTPAAPAAGTFLLAAWLKALLAAKDSNSNRVVLTRPRQNDLPCTPMQPHCSLRVAHRELKGTRGTRLESSRLGINMLRLALLP